MMQYILHNSIIKKVFNDYSRDNTYSINWVYIRPIFMYYQVLFFYKNSELYKDYLLQLNKFIDKYYGKSKLNEYNIINNINHYSNLYNINNPSHQFTLKIKIPSLLIDTLDIAYSDLINDDILNFNILKDISQCVCLKIHNVECQLNTTDLIEFSNSIINDIIRTNNIDLQNVYTDVNDIKSHKFYQLYNEFITPVNNVLLNFEDYITDKIDVTGTISMLNNSEHITFLPLVEICAKVFMDKVFVNEKTKENFQLSKLFNTSILSYEDAVSFLYKSMTSSLFSSNNYFANIKLSIESNLPIEPDRSKEAKILNTSQAPIQDFLNLL